MSNRDIDLVIRNEKDMEKVIKFLIYNLKTLDGTKDSAVNLIEKMKYEKIKSLSVCPVRQTYDKRKEIDINE